MLILGPLFNLYQELLHVKPMQVMTHRGDLLSELVQRKGCVMCGPSYYCHVYSFAK